MRTLRRFLTGQYDGTGLASRVLRSGAWHAGALGVVAALVLGLIVAYHVYWADLPLGDFATTSMGMAHMFPKIQYFTWIVYALPALFVLVHVRRMYRFTVGRARLPLRLFVAEARTLVLHAVTHRNLRKCPAEAREARAYERWLQGEDTPGVEVVPDRWLKHWLMALGTVVMVVLTALFLPWFQTEALHPLYHPQRLLGYLATVLILWGTSDILRRRLWPRPGVPRRRGALTLPLLLWLTAVSGLLVHVLRYLDLALAAHYAYALHLVVCVPMVVVEVPFGEWAHMIDRPLALYFQAVLERAREERSAEAGLLPEPA
jgi:hypothetical protein